MPNIVLVFLGLFGGLAFLLISNPLHTACRSQMTELTHQHTPFFILDKSLKFQEKTEHQQALEACRKTNTPGGCLRLFNGIRELTGSLESLPSDCITSLCTRKEFNQPLWDAVDILVRIGWGDVPPQDIYEQTRWLDRSHFLLFCRMKKILNTCHGEDRWNQEQEKILYSLPGSEDMTRKDIWRKALFAISCRNL